MYVIYRRYRPMGSWEPNGVLGLHRSDQSGEVSSTKEQFSMKEKESARLKEIRRERKAKTNGHPADSMTLT